MTGASAASSGLPDRGRGLGRGPRFLWAAAVGLEYAGAARMVLFVGSTARVRLLGLGSTAGWPVAGRGQHRKRRSVRGAQRLGATPGSNDRARTASTVVLCATLQAALRARCLAWRRSEVGGQKAAMHCERSMTRGILRVVVGGETPHSTASRRHTTPTRGITQGTFMSLIYRRGRGTGGRG